MPQNKMRILSIDPGDTTGWCYLEAPDTILGYGNLPYASLIEFIGDWDYAEKPIDVFLVEDFIMFDRRRQRFGDRQKTTRALGAIEVAARMSRTRLVKQDSSVIQTAIKRTGIDPTKGSHKKTHWAYAYLHAAYYLTLLGLRKSALQLAREKK